MSDTLLAVTRPAPPTVFGLLFLGMLGFAWIS